MSVSLRFPECSGAAPSPGKEWDEYVQIRTLVEKIRKKQKGVVASFLFFSTENWCIPHYSASVWRLMALSRSSPAGVSVGFEGSREDYFPELMAWAAECGASCEGFEIASFGDEGYGLRATRDIKVCV